MNISSAAYFFNHIDRHKKNILVNIYNHTKRQMLTHYSGGSRKEKKKSKRDRVKNSKINEIGKSIMRNWLDGENFISPLIFLRIGIMNWIK